MQQAQTKPLRYILATALLAVAVAAPGCGDDENPGDDDVGPTPDAALPRPDATPLAPDATPLAPVEVQVLAFNDFHGNVEPPAGSSGTVVTARPEVGPPVTVPAGGAAFFAERIATLRGEHPNTVVVSAGDLIGASPMISAIFHDEPTIEAMNLIGLDLAAVGNHEFDDGSAELLRMQFGGCHPGDGCQDGSGFGGAAFTFLAANVVVDPVTGKTLFPRYQIREYDGVPVAFIGMTLEATPTIVTPLGISGLAFLDEATIVNALVPELQALDVEAIVVLVHEGGFQTGLYDECVGISGAIVGLVGALDPAVDLVVSGHTHAAYNCEIAGKRVTSALSFGRLVTRILMTIDRDSHEVLAVDAENLIVERTGSGVAAVATLVAAYDTLIAPLRDRVIGSTTAALTRTGADLSLAGETVLGEVIADAQLAATAAVITGGARVAFMNPGGIRADVDAGDVTCGEAFTVQPFGNSLVTMTLTGAQIDTLLELQFDNPGPGSNRILQVSEGFTYSWSAAAAKGSKVDAASIKLNGVPIDPSASYRVTVNNFMADGGDGYTILRSGTNRLGGDVDLDALEKYFIAQGVVAPGPQNRITRLP